MMVTIRTAAWLKELLGGKMEVRAEGLTVAEALRNAGILESVGDGKGGVKVQYSLHINGGEDVSLGCGIETALRDGDVVSIITPIAGGGAV
jgi:molybdopterin converting factor small subunit